MNRTAHYLQRDWNNKKEITNKQIAECVVENNIPLDKVPEPRRGGVMKEIQKIHIRLEKERMKDEVERTLWTEIDLVKADNWLGYDIVEADEGDYILDPDLFDTEEQAYEAKEWLYCLVETVIFDENLRFKDHRRYREKLERLKQKLLKAAEEYEELGGDPNLILSLPKPDLPPAKRWINEYRGPIAKDLMELGLSKTRAEKAAIEITKIAYHNISKPL